MDKGCSWIKYEGNLVFLNLGICDFCDFKVIWDGDFE